MRLIALVFCLPQRALVARGTQERVQALRHRSIGRSAKTREVKSPSHAASSPETFRSPEKQALCSPLHATPTGSLPLGPAQADFLLHFEQASV